jgi:hypothetical protein
MNEEVNLWDEIMEDELHKQIYNVGFQKGKLEQKKEELELLDNDLRDITRGGEFVKTMYINSVIEERIKQLQKEIGDEKQDEDS